MREIIQPPEEMREDLLSCLEKAKAGDLESQYKLGLRYYLEHNPEQAERWLIAAANQGIAGAQNTLGSLYYDQEKYSEALACYQRAAEQKNADALVNLGDMYLDGTGVEQNFPAAMDCFQKAKELGSARAINNIGEMQYFSYGVEQNHTEAFKCFTEAAGLGDAVGQYNLGIMLLEGHHSAEEEPNPVAALRWFRASADQGFVPAQQSELQLYTTQPENRQLGSVTQVFFRCLQTLTQCNETEKEELSGYFRKYVRFQAVNESAGVKYTTPEFVNLLVTLPHIGLGGRPVDPIIADAFSEHPKKDTIFAQAQAKQKVLRCDLYHAARFIPEGLQPLPLEVMEHVLSCFPRAGVAENRVNALLHERFTTVQELERFHTRRAEERDIGDRIYQCTPLEGLPHNPLATLAEKSFQERVVRQSEALRGK